MIYLGDSGAGSVFARVNFHPLGDRKKYVWPCSVEIISIIGKSLNRTIQLVVLHCRIANRIYLKQILVVEAIYNPTDTSVVV